MTPDEIAAVKAEHLQMHTVHFEPMGWCAPCNSKWPCLPYRLAVEVERLASEVQGAWRRGYNEGVEVASSNWP